ncbi:hypothetical protein Mzhil_1524 [Methanosalsum zhilinae DSM 4017]|uniref:GPR1/FUN34/yaaH family protein n=1 Tax=Methanosalsum zhilinae (strain DSM 4017 / NBRC 107636 / OCM 62 / WeN5) TaxID=679901 RepID=F7XP70_METZD|nr:hypothetical protein [Methanosalsum zhilinae]AEH61363.1 hypothetical protein Mzhil_1524 [Methanosalsum zhilinae DSM 4017]
MSMELIVVLLAAAFLTDFVALMPVGAFLLGVGEDARPIWIILLIGGIVHFITGILVILASDAAAFGETAALVGYAIIVFGWIFVGIAYMSYREFEATGVGHLALFSAGIFLVYAIADIMFGYLIWALIMLTIVAILLIVAAMDYGKISGKVCGACLILFSIEAFIIGLGLIVGFIAYGVPAIPALGI